MVFDFLRRDGGTRAEAAVPERKASAAGPIVAWHSQGRVAWSPRDAVSLTKSGFAGNPVGFRSVKLIAEAAAALPLVLQDRVKRYDVHPVLSLVRRPNAAQGRAELMEALFGQLLLSGNAYVEAVPGEEGQPVELHVLRSDRMAVVPGADGWPVAYEYSVAGRKHRFDVTGQPNICHIKTFHPQDDHYGLSPLQAAAMAVDVHNSASRWSKSLLDNAARPSGALVYKGSDGQGQMADDQFRRLSDEIETFHQGARNAGRPMLLEGGLDWKAMSLSPADMDFATLKAAAARDIALAFGVPPMLLGLPGDNTYANYREANRALWRLTLLPLAGKILAGLHSGLADWFAEAPSVDLDRVPALAEDRERLWAQVSGASFLTDLEKRELLGLATMENGR